MRPALVFTLGLIAASLGTTHAARADEARIPWKTSHIAGTPDRPPPYTVEPAFPKLTFDRPLVLAPVPGSNRLAVGELTGKVLTFPNDPAVDRADIALDLAPLRAGFSALYGLTFHPRFEDNRSIYICYVLENEKPDATRVSRFQVSRTDPPQIDPSTETVLITWLSGGHNGGCLAFGNDGYLYISTGDAGPASPPDPLVTGQDLTDLLGSILRIDVDHADPGRPYRVPPDNPFIHQPGARPEIWAYGLRNPWRFSIDRTTGDLWVGDVGWELWELIYRIERGGNYGWSAMEGRQPVRRDAPRGPTPILPPLVDHPHSEAASITGGYVYRGRHLRELVGTYVYGDYQSGKVWGLRPDGPQPIRPTHLADTGLRLVSFGEDHANELYLIEHERTNQLYRLVPAPAPKVRARFPLTLSQTGLFASTSDHTPAPGVIPYTINAEAWADGATAQRWLAVPGTATLDFDPRGIAKVPEGTVLAKTISLDLTAGDPCTRRRLETQLLHFEEGSWRPYTYIWNDDQTDATLAPAEGASRTFTVRDDHAPGARRELAYRFPARSECLLCHNPWVDAGTTVFGRQSASPLALSPAQLDRPIAPESNQNQLRHLERLGYFSRPISTSNLPRLADPYDETADLSIRARSYLQVNCTHCHQFNAGGSAEILLAASLPLEQTKTVGVRPLQGSFGIDDARIIAPGEPDRSVLFYRVAKTGAGRMPRLGSHHVDVRATRLLADWIAQMPRPADHPPATIPELPPDAPPETIRPWLDTTQGALSLVRLIDRGDVPESTTRQIVALARDHPRVEVRDLFERYLPDDQRIRRLGESIDLDALLALPADPRRGRDWFVNDPAAQCRTCHRLEGVGTDVGPDLAAIGSKYSKRDLLRHLIDPSREVDPKYRTTLVETTDGLIIEGIITERTDRELVLRDAKAETHRILLDQIEREATPARSLMPDQLLRDLTAQQAADLLEYLAAQKAPRP